MIKIIKQWMFHPAKWWEFWYPMSGPFGGATAAALAVIAFYFIYWGF
jgi:glycerol uptake facilitator-like aquaporin